MESENTLKVTMLGKFTLSYRGETIIGEDLRNTRSILLLQYLLIKENHSATKDELFKILQISEKSDNPYNLLKNTVYRLRKLFDASSFKSELILYKNSSYYLNTELDYDIDTINFMDISKELHNNTYSNEEELKLITKALDLYQGDFLPKQSGEIWVITESINLQNAYFYILKKAYSLLKEEKSDLILSYLDEAIYLYPYEESLQAMKVSCLIEMGQYEKATTYYNDVAMMFLNELGIVPGKELSEAYEALSVKENTESIKEIRDDISEEKEEDGAYFTNITSFISTYRFVVRNFERNGISVFLLLCTLKEKNGTSLKRGKYMTDACNSFHEAAKMSMRRGDIYTRYNPSQFLILLTNINQENCNVVTRRIEKNFSMLFPNRNIILSCQILPAVDIKTLIDKGVLTKESFKW